MANDVADVPDEEHKMLQDGSRRSLLFWVAFLSQTSFVVLTMWTDHEFNAPQLWTLCRCECQSV